MKKIVCARVQPPNAPGASITRAQSSHTVPCSPSKSRSSSRARPSALDPGSPQSKPFFYRWLDTWKSQNGGDHGQSR